MDTTAFKSWIAEKREEFEADIEDGIAEASGYRDFLRGEIRAYRHLWRAPVRTVADLRAELKTAQAAAYLDGATDAQVETIIRLAAAAGDFGEIGTTRLTGAAADRIISTF